MKARLIPLALIAGLLLTVGVIAVACGGGGGDGGGGSLTIEQYFERLETLAARFDDRGTELEEGFDVASATSDDEVIGLSQDFLRGGLGVLQDFVNDLDELNPQADVADAHDAAVGAGRAAVAAFQDVVDQVDDVGSAADLEGLFEVFAEGGPFDDFTDTCFALQEIANDAAISVDLKCGE